MIRHVSLAVDRSLCAKDWQQDPGAFQPPYKTPTPTMVYFNQIPVGAVHCAPSNFLTEIAENRREM